MLAALPGAGTHPSFGLVHFLSAGDMASTSCHLGRTTRAHPRPFAARGMGALLDAKLRSSSSTARWAARSGSKSPAPPCQGRPDRAGRRPSQPTWPGGARWWRPGDAADGPRRGAGLPSFCGSSTSSRCSRSLLLLALGGLGAGTPQAPPYEVALVVRPRERGRHRATTRFSHPGELANIISAWLEGHEIVDNPWTSRGGARLPGPE